MIKLLVVTNACWCNHLVASLTSESDSKFATCSKGAFNHSQLTCTQKRGGNITIELCIQHNYPGIIFCRGKQGEGKREGGEI